MIRTIEEVKRYYSKLNANSDYETLSSFLREAVDEVTYFLGDELYDELLLSYTNDTPTQLQAKLIALAQSAIVHFCMKEYITFSDSTIGDLGVNKTSVEYVHSQNTEILDKILDKSTQDIDKSINKMLSFLEKNAVYFTSWQTSTYFVESKTLLIGSSLEFSKIFGIENSAIAFLLLLPHIKNVEIQEIENNFSEQFLLDLKEKQANGTLSDKEKKAVDTMKRCITFSTMQYALPQMLFEVKANSIRASVVTTTNAQKSNPQDAYTQRIIEQVTKNASFYFETLKKYLNENVQDFPIYRDSGKYTPPPESATFSYCSDEDNVFFMK